jgi:hypothetical protein
VEIYDASKLGHGEQEDRECPEHTSELIAHYLCMFYYCNIFFTGLTLREFSNEVLTEMFGRWIDEKDCRKSRLEKRYNLYSSRTAVEEMKWDEMFGMCSMFGGYTNINHCIDLGNQWRLVIIGTPCVRSE